MTDEFKVILIRGKLEPREYVHADETSAMQRAIALSDLHGVKVTMQGNVFTIDASDYYGK